MNLFRNARRQRGSARGQSLVEMALILPFLLAFAGGAADFARAYQAWLTVESASRNAAEYVANNSADASAATTDAKRIVCLEAQNVPGFVPGTGPKPLETCSAPAVTTSFSTSSTAVGASTRNPIGTAHVTVSLSFQTLFPYPFLPHGAVTLKADRTYAIVRGR